MLYAKTKYTLSISCCIFFGIILGFSEKGISQFAENFSDGNLDLNPSWFGNTNHFIVNSFGELQLNASAAGESYVYTPYKLPQDSLEIDLLVKMTFDPSDNNQSVIYLLLDNPDVSVANGYFLRLGENGTNDNIKIFRLTAGIPELMASCALGAIARDPVRVRLKMLISRDGLWRVETNYEGDTILTPDTEWMDPGIFTGFRDVYFGIFCKYTSTRTKNFFFDDLYIQKWVRDTTPPVVAAFKVLDDKRLEITFNERLNPGTALDPERYAISNNLLLPKNVSFGSAENIIVVTFAQEVQSGVSYTMNINAVSDISGNSLTSSFSFFRAVPAGKNDLILNEILTDPLTGGEDFIELFNISSKFIQLQGLVIRNDSKNEEKSITTDWIMKPGEYAAISKNTDFLKTTYRTPETAVLIRNELPSLNVADAEVHLVSDLNGTRIVVDSFAYLEDFHYSLLNETKGVSLERILADGPSDNPNNWHSASQASGFGTPGYQNSNYQNPRAGSEEIVLLNKSFSPYSSAIEPFLLIQYNLEKSGYLATIRIFDTEGFPVRSLANNLLLGREGVIKWDGFSDENIPVKMGWYVVATRLFHPDGDVREFKHSVVAIDQW